MNGKVLDYRDEYEPVAVLVLLEGNYNVSYCPIANFSESIAYSIMLDEHNIAIFSY